MPLYQHGKNIIQIAFADDNQLLQDLIPSLIDGFENCKVTIQAANGEELLEKLTQKSDTSLVLMDIKMPLLDGVEAAKMVKQKFPDIKILFFSIYSNELVYKRVLASGADGFLTKNCTSGDLKGAIYSVMKSGFYLNLGIPPFLHTGFHTGRQFRNGHIIKVEEIEFLKLVGTEMTYEAIAHQMKKSLRHIDYIREGLFEKFGLKSRVELAILAYSAGIGGE